MKIKVLTDKTIKWLIDSSRKGFLKPNPEYQRAPEWKEHHEQMFIDSVFRRYSIPAFYFHHKKAPKGLSSLDTLYIVDGQQRINALRNYYEGEFTLLNPKYDSKFHFPNFVRGEDCPWAGKGYQDLDKDLKAELLQQPVVIYHITTEDENKVRDLFIRLQGGIPLTAQQKRDSWPGEFTKYIFRLGGRQEQGFSGNPFFTEIAKPVGAESNQRKLASTVFMLYSHRRESPTRSLCDSKSGNIDNFYRQRIDFDDSTEETKRFEEILDTLVDIFSTSRSNKKLKAHHAIGLVLLVDSLLDDYTSGWEEKLYEAIHIFNKRCADAKKAEKNNQPSAEHREYYGDYVRWTRTSSDSAFYIQRRHGFFAKTILSWLKSQGTLKRKNPDGVFSNMEKEIIYHRDGKMCQICRMRGDPEADASVIWPGTDTISDAEFYTLSKNPTVDDAILIRKENYPQAEEAKEEIRQWVESRMNSHFSFNTPPNKFPPSEGTECRFTYRGETHKGKIVNRMLVVGGRRYRSFSAASHDLTGTNRNGWNDWWLTFPYPDSGKRVLADNWRRDTSSVSSERLRRSSHYSWHSKGVELPEGTKLLLDYPGVNASGEIRNGAWFIEGETYNSPSSAACAIISRHRGRETSVNGWMYWCVQRPGIDKEWVPIHSLRDNVDRRS